MKKALKEEFKKVGSLLTVERSVWQVHLVEQLPHGGERVIDMGNGWAYEGVKLQEQDGKLRLVAAGRRQQHAPVIPDGPEILISLINLVKQPIPWEQVDEAVSAEESRTWCADYGLPEVESVDSCNLDRPKLSLSRFQRETLTLVLLWRVWRALIDPYPDKATLARDLPQLWKARASQRRGVTDRWREILLKEAESMAKLPTEELEARARSGVADLLNERIERVNLMFAWGDPTPRLRLVAVSLFDIAYVQMASLLTRPDDENTDYRMQNLKECRNCQDLFWWPHGNRRYCPRPQCDRRAVYRRQQAQCKAASVRPNQAKSL